MPRRNEAIPGVKKVEYKPCESKQRPSDEGIELLPCGICHPALSFFTGCVFGLRAAHPEVNRCKNFVAAPVIWVLCKMCFDLCDCSCKIQALWRRRLKPSR